MFEKFLIVASKKDKAGINITTHLSTLGKFWFMLVEEEALFEENLDLEKIEKFDFIIFASKHQSSSNNKTLTIHSPGNFLKAEFGGKDHSLCPSSALFNKQLFENLNLLAKESGLNKKYEVSLEATHHGPLISKPCVFIEIGSTDFEYNDKKAAFVIAKTIKKTIEEFKENPYNEIAIGIGGPHYCPGFNKLQTNSNVAFSHIIPGYIEGIDERMILEAIKKTNEEVDFAVIDWKGLKSEQRKRVIKILEKNYINYKKTGEVGV
jgi:D-aminoacyl-tRNA deacylase